MCREWHITTIWGILTYRFSLVCVVPTFLQKQSHPETVCEQFLLSVTSQYMRNVISGSFKYYPQCDCRAFDSTVYLVSCHVHHTWDITWVKWSRFMSNWFVPPPWLVGKEARRRLWPRGSQGGWNFHTEPWSTIYTLSICRQGKHGGAAGGIDNEDMVENVDLLDATRPGSWLAIASTSFW